MPTINNWRSFTVRDYYRVITALLVNSTKETQKCVVKFTQSNKQIWPSVSTLFYFNIYNSDVCTYVFCKFIQCSAKVAGLNVIVSCANLTFNAYVSYSLSSLPVGNSHFLYILGERIVRTLLSIVLFSLLILHESVKWIFLFRSLSMFAL